MRPLIILSTMFLMATSAWAKVTEKNCRIYDVNDKNNVWEEGVGEFGDPNSDSDSQTVELWTSGRRTIHVGVGQMSWDEVRASIKTDTKPNKDKIILVKPNGSKVNIQIKLYPSERGSVYFLRKPTEKFLFVAKFDCSSTDEAVKANIDTALVKELTTKEYKALPKVVRDRLDSFDIAFAMGDGYYDVIDSKYYRVVNKKGELIGYKLWANMSYTEGDDTEATVTYDRNGLPLIDSLE